MSVRKMKKNEAAFDFLEHLVICAIKQSIELDGEWGITKILFENEWEAQPFNSSVQETYGLQVSSDEVNVDLMDEDDDESLTNCYVTLDASGKLAAELLDHGVNVDANRNLTTL